MTTEYIVALRCPRCGNVRRADVGTDPSVEIWCCQRLTGNDIMRGDDRVEDADDMAGAR